MRVLTVSSTITESHKNNGYAQSPKGGGVAELFLIFFNENLIFFIVYIERKEFSFLQTMKRGRV